MAYLTQTLKSGLGDRLAAQLSNGLRQAALHRARMRVYRQSLAELRGLSDRELNDIGMNRAMLQQVAWDTALKTVTA